MSQSSIVISKFISTYPRAVRYIVVWDTKFVYRYGNVRNTPLIMVWFKCFCLLFKFSSRMCILKTMTTNRKLTSTLFPGMIILAWTNVSTLLNQIEPRFIFFPTKIMFIKKQNLVLWLLWLWLLWFYSTEVIKYDFFLSALLPPPPTEFTAPKDDVKPTFTFTR